MIPDATTIARRRHVCTMVVRSGAVVFGVWVAIDGVQGLWAPLYEAIMQGGFASLVQGLVVHVPLLVLAAALALGSSAIVRWIVPYPPREATCPKCGYSLKNLKSPICPECGTDLK